MSMFPGKQWLLDGLKKLIRKIDDTGTVDRRSAPGSGRPCTARVADKIDEVHDLVLSQNNGPNTHRTRRQIARQTGISLTSVHIIINSNLRLKCLKKRHAHESMEANKIARRDRCHKLLKHYPASMVNFCWFAGEKIFTVAAPGNCQNDRLYAPIAVRKKDVAADQLLRTRPTFSKLVMVSVGVTALGRTNIHFVDPGVKVNGQYYRHILLMRYLLPDIKQYSAYFTFQQDGASAHPARENCRTSERRDTRLHSTKFLATQQPRSKRSQLQYLRRTARTGLQDKH